MATTATSTAPATTTTPATPAAPAAEPVKKIKAIVLTSTGGGNDYSNLTVREEDYPKFSADKAESNEVIVRVKACGLNFAELMQRQGFYKPSHKTPYTPGFEVAGIVEQVGDKATGGFRVGDHVMCFNGWNMWKEVVVVPSTQCVKMPKKMSFEEAAGIFLNYVTAYQIINDMANVKPGDSVLIHMAAGGVGFAATQILKTISGVTIFGTASESKHQAIKENGVDHPIDYHSKDYVEEIRKISPKGIDVVMDPLNGEHAIKGYHLLKPFGRIVHYGAAGATTENKSLINVFKVWWKCLNLSSLEIVSENKSMSGYHLGYLLGNPDYVEKATRDLQHILGLWEQNKIKVHIDSTHSFTKVSDAFKLIHAHKNVGKIILKPDCEMPQEEVKPEAEKPAETTTAEIKKEEKESNKKETKSPKSSLSFKKSKEEKKKMDEKEKSTEEKKKPATEPEKKEEKEKEPTAATD